VRAQKNKLHEQPGCLVIVAYNGRPVALRPRLSNEFAFDQSLVS